MNQREIKFRAFDNRAKNMLYSDANQTVWVGGIQPSVNVAGLGDQIPGDWMAMQFTGLMDKNGVDIYDGDVLRFVGGTCTNLTSSGYHNNYVGTLFVVSWLDSGWTLQLPTVVKSHAPDIPNIISNVTNYDFWNHQRSLEVIGNIHQNPELL